MILIAGVRVIPAGLCGAIILVQARPRVSARLNSWLALCRGVEGRRRGEKGPASVRAFRGANGRWACGGVDLLVGEWDALGKGCLALETTTVFSFSS